MARRMVLSKKVESPLASKNDDIDLIFENKSKPNEIGLKKIQNKVRKGRDSDRLKFTEEGFRILKLDELVSKGGGKSSLCPFDCKCCY